MLERLCKCEGWFPHYEKFPPICWNCDLPLSKERSDIASKFWEICCPEDFRQGNMYEKTKLQAVFYAWQAIVLTHS
jgi:hypothetical protein